MHFKHHDIEAFWIDCEANRPRRVPPEARRALFRKLQMLEAAEEAGDLNALRIPPGNRLEALTGAQTGKYSIRVNNQWRLVFSWTPAGVREVEFCDYH